MRVSMVLPSPTARTLTIICSNTIPWLVCIPSQNWELGSGQTPDLRQHRSCGGRQKGFRFTHNQRQSEADAFAVRSRWKVLGYINECGHIPAELDWLLGEFYDNSKLYLICSVNGVLYALDSGRCLGGRCQGKVLAALAVDEADGQLFLVHESVHG